MAGTSLTGIFAPGAPALAETLRTLVVTPQRAVAPGETIRIEFAFSNLGGAPATDVRVRFALPQGVAHVEGEDLVDERPIAELVARNGELAAVAFTDGRRLARSGMLVATTVHQRSRLAGRLGVNVAEPTAVAQDQVAVDPMCRTNVPGVFAAGDLSARMPQVAAAIAAGSLAAASVVQSLLAEDVGLPVGEWRENVVA